MKPSRILIVDDESNIRLMLRTALESESYEMDEAANGREALERLRKGPVDLIILDLSMPVMDGMAVLQALQDCSPEEKPRVVVLTAYGSVQKAVRAMRLGASDFLEKPITPEELRQTVASVLDEPRPHAEEEPPPTYDEVLTAVREALRDGSLNTAESLLMKAGSITAEDAAFLNLVGVFHEAMGRKDVAKRFYGKAIRARHDYAPAQQNMRRMYELSIFGWTKQPVALGDEPEVLARLDERNVGLAAKLKKLLKMKE